MYGESVRGVACAVCTYVVCGSWDPLALFVGTRPGTDHGCVLMIWERGMSRIYCSCSRAVVGILPRSAYYYMQSRPALANRMDPPLHSPHQPPSINYTATGTATAHSLCGYCTLYSYMYVLAGPARAARSSLSVPHLSWTGRARQMRTFDDFADASHAHTDHLPVLPCGSDATRGIGASIGRIRSSNPLRNHPCSLLWGSEKTPRGLREGTGEGRSMYRQRRKQGLQIRIHCDRTAT